MVNPRAMLFGVLAVWLSAASANAQTPEERVRAQALFEQARELMNQGQIQQACPLFEASLEVTYGAGIEYNLAECYAQSGRLASALERFDRVRVQLRKEGDTERAEKVDTRIAELAPRVLKLRIVAERPVSGMEVRRSTVVVGPADLGREIPVDPGSYIVDAMAPGHEPWTTTVQVIGEGRVIEVHIPPLSAIAGTAAVPPPAPVPDAPPADSEDTHPLVIVGLVTAGVGVAGLVVGGITGVIAITKKGDSEPHCVEPLRCDATGAELVEDAQLAGTISTAAFVVGGILTAAGVTLWLVAPSDDGVAVGVAPTGVQLRSAF